MAGDDFTKPNEPFATTGKTVDKQIWIEEVQLFDAARSEEILVDSKFSLKRSNENAGWQNGDETSKKVNIKVPEWENYLSRIFS